MIRRFLRGAFYWLGSGAALVAGVGLLARFISPAAWWPPALLALVLPGFLLLTFLFVGWCVYRRRWRWAAFPILISLSALPLYPRLFSVRFGADAGARGEKTEQGVTTDTTLTVLTANVRNFKDDSYAGVSDSLAMAFLRSSAPDILMLQESRHHRWKKRYWNRIKTVTGLSERRQPRGKTVATYANRMTFVADEFAGGEGYNGFVVSDVRTELGTIRVINAHLMSNQISRLAADIGEDDNLEAGARRAKSMFAGYGRAAAGRAGQAELIRKYVRESPHPVVVGGDFNDVPSGYAYQRILTPRLRDAWVERGFGIGTTFTGPLPGLRIDYLLVDTALTVRSIDRVETGYSDHRALRATLSPRLRQ